MGYFVKVEPDVRIYVEVVNPEGDKTILFIHGWPLSHKQYEYQFNRLPAKGYRCIGIDLRGFGRSDKPWGGYNLDRMSDDVRCVVETLQLQCFTLGGHSYGGAIAVRYMARHYGYGVSKLALFGGAVPSVTQRPGFPYGLPKEEVTKIVEETYSNRPNMLRGIGDLFFFQYVSEPFAKWFFELGLAASGNATAKVAVSFRDESLFTDLDQVNVPTLILHGIHDKICLPQLALAQKQGIKDAKLVWLQFSGHGLFYEQREQFNEELMTFIEGD
jgi:non-heme chloroperoxidase